MTADEQAQVKQIYKEFEKLAHLMDDWAKEFDSDMAQFNKPTSGSVNKQVSSPSSTPSSSGRKDTGSRTSSGWRNLQEGTSRAPVDQVTTVGKYNYGIHYDDSYVHVGQSAYPEDARTPTFMDTVQAPKPVQTPQPPSRPPQVLPTVIDMTKDIKRPRAPETKEIMLTPKDVPQPQTPSVYSLIPTAKPKNNQ